jgi:putative transposase
MPKKRYTPDEILAKRGRSMCWSHRIRISLTRSARSVSARSYYRWRQEYGGLKTEQVKRQKELETENVRLR